MTYLTVMEPGHVRPASFGSRKDAVWTVRINHSIMYKPKGCGLLACLGPPARLGGEDGGGTSRFRQHKEGGCLFVEKVQGYYITSSAVDLQPGDMGSLL